MLNVRATGFTAGLIWGAAMLLTSLLNLATGYGLGFLELMSGLYPGYDPAGGLPATALGTLYGFVDGWVTGTVFAWLYNRLSR